MANEFKHGSVGNTLTQTEWEAVGTHVFNSQATGDILYASSATQLSRLGVGANGTVLTLSSGVPAWTASPSVTAITGATVTATALLASTFDMGTSGSPNSYAAGAPIVEVYATSSNATATNAEPFYVKSVMTGAGGYGGRSRFHAYTNVALGSNFMALKAHTEYGSSGSCAGLSTGLCSELVMPNADITSAGGAYYALELEYVSGGTSLVTNGTGCQAGFIYMNQTGDDNGDFDDNGWFMRVDGLTAGATHILSAGSQTLKVNLEGTTRYLVMSTAENCITMGASGSPVGDFTLWGTTALYKVWFDINGDTNGAWYFGADDYGVDVGFYGQTSGASLVWDASADYLIYTNTALGANARGTRQIATVATPAMSDGYGVWEQEVTVSGTATGHINASSCWINLGTSAVVPGYITLRNDGIWDGTATLTNAYVSMQKYHMMLQSNPAWCSIWELNWDNAHSEIDTMFNCNNADLALGYLAGTPTKAAVGSIPFCSTAGGTIRYIYLYDAADSD